jgi:hypothetical protein
MLGPGEYLVDPTAGITDPKDLRRPRIVQRSRNYSHLPSRQCSKRCFRDKVVTRRFRDLGDLVSGRPREIHLTYPMNCWKRHRETNGQEPRDRQLTRLYN